MRLDRWFNGLRPAAFAIAAATMAAATPAAAQVSAQLSAQLDTDALRVGASMADLTAPQLRADILRSPLFIAEIDTEALMQGGPVAIELEAGVELDLQQYLAGTRLTNQPLLAIATAEPARLNLAGPARFTEQMFVMEDRIIVSREAVLQVTPETCGLSARRERQRPGGRSGMAGAIREELGIVTTAREELCFLPGERSLEELADAANEGGRPVIVDPSEILTPRLQRQSREIQGGTRLLLPPTRDDVSAEAAEIRAELARMNPDAEFRRGITVREAQALGDGQLIRLDANGDERVITHVSIIPLAPRTSELQPFDRRLDDAALGRGFGLDRPIGPRLQVLPPALAPYSLTQRSLRPDRQIRTVPPGQLQLLPEIEEVERAAPGGTLRTIGPVNPRTLTIQRLPGTEPREREPINRQRISHSANYYFITGFTLSDRIEERFRHTFNRRKNYYVGFEYSIGYAAGLRFPFRVEVENETFFSQDPQTRLWNAENFQFRVNAEARQDTLEGGSIYRAAGMPQDLILGDREFTFGLWARCQFQARVPVIKTIRINCPSVEVPRAGTCPNWACADFTPPIGRRTLIAQPRLPADVTRLQIDAWVVRAGIEPGVNVYAANAEFSLRANAEDGRFAAPGSASTAAECAPQIRGDPRRSNIRLPSGDCRLVFASRYDASRPMMFQLDLGEPGTSRLPGVTLSDPEYSFTMEFVPVLELFAELDLAFARWRVSHEFEIAGLTIRQDMRFTHHDRTRETGEIGFCGPRDAGAPGCSRAAGFVFHPIQVDTGGPG
ncbi:MULTISPECIES: hypothetical protein [Hyphobacterium]|uniref:LPS-assembly protein LptD n=1 Tax=Hyphobacterium vulgare TaxID=1736751 RepID=A0ABV6ZZA3_9PROT